jgi:hypothetical protein
MSAGIRSGVNWIRLKSRLSASASVRTSSVLPSPARPRAARSGERRGSDVVIVGSLRERSRGPAIRRGDVDGIGTERSERRGGVAVGRGGGRGRCDREGRGGGEGAGGGKGPGGRAGHSGGASGAVADLRRERFPAGGTARHADHTRRRTRPTGWTALRTGSPARSPLLRSHHGLSAPRSSAEPLRGGAVRATGSRSRDRSRRARPRRRSPHRRARARHRVPRG